jgi:hypothetical protein
MPGLNGEDEAAHAAQRLVDVAASIWRVYVTKPSWAYLHIERATGTCFCGFESIENYDWPLWRNSELRANDKPICPFCQLAATTADEVTS